MSFALATVAIRNFGSQTNSLNRESLNRFFALFCAVEVEVIEINWLDFIEYLQWYSQQGEFEEELTTERREK